ncbi:MAG: hypothetical protein G01um101470_1167, partial [Parcubacteria group bacterium Gr01-1014_70]
RKRKPKKIVLVDTYLKENWAKKSKQELADDLGLQVSTIDVYLSRLRLPRHTVPTDQLKQYHNIHEGLSLRQQLKAQIEKVIKECWETETDRALALQLGVSTFAIRRYRLDLGLKRRVSPWSGRNERLIDRIKQIGELVVEDLLIKEGYTSTEVIRLHDIRTSRERFRQVIMKLNIKHSPEERMMPEWLIHRYARQQGNMNLADKEWLNEQLQNSFGIAELAAQLSVAEFRLAKIIHLFGLTHPSFRKLGRDVVNLVCASCGKEFKRLRRWVKRKEKMFPGSKFVCKSGCGNFRKQKKLKRLEYVKKHWPRLSDGELAKALGVGDATIKRYRAELGLSFDGAGSPIDPVT